MSRNIVLRIFVAGAAIASLGTAACTRAKSTDRQQTRVERGKYLVTVGGCNDCHTPLKMGPKGPEPDFSRMRSGHPDSFPISSATTPASDKWMLTAAASGTAFSGLARRASRTIRPGRSRP
jgi:mono/diheme cytochrome c family protein